MLMPKRTKWRKQQKGRNRGKSFNGNKIEFGDINSTFYAVGSLHDSPRQHSS